VNSTENRLRAAALAVADTIPQGSAPPLRLDEPRRHRSGAAQARWRRGRRGWADRMTPLAAATAVLAVVAASLAVTHGWSRSPDANAAAGPAGTPAYYVSLAAYAGSGDGRPGAATVRSTGTGDVLARITPPRPFSGFTVVAGATDDHTFVLGALRSLVVTKTAPAAELSDTPPLTFLPSVVTSERVTDFFVLHLGQATGSFSITPVKAAPEFATVTGLALSPDGRKLAVALSPPGRLEIQVINLVTWSVRTWQGKTWPTAGSGRYQWNPASFPSSEELSWAADNRTLTFQWPGGTRYSGQGEATLSVSRLDTSAPGTSLASGSVPVPPAGYLIAFTGSTATAGSGAVIAATGLQPAVSSPPQAVNPDAVAVVYAARTGHILRQLTIRHYEPLGITAPTRVLWTNTTASVLIVLVEVYPNQGPASGAGDSFMAGVLTRSRFTPLPGLTVPDTSVMANPGGIAW
jgi:hypothetical protein